VSPLPAESVREPRVLVVGQIEGAVESTLHNGSSIRSCQHMLEAISLAGRERFDAIFVVLNGLDAHLESALMTLRRASHSTRLVLLATMAEEVRARRLVRSVRAPRNVADDYLLCPLSGEELLATVAPSEAPPAPAQAVDAARLSELERLATEDDLTGLKNRRYLGEFLRQILRHANQEGFQITLLLFDIDDFKHYNDAFGHSVGDNVLREAALLIRRCCREHDVVARIGGDEFAVVFWDRPDRPANPHEPERRTAAEHPRQAYFMAERFRRQISDSNLSSLGAVGQGTLTISGGLAAFPQDAQSADTLFQRADQALLEAKRQGKNRIVLVGRDSNV
jgi:diguanylate cyclase (GGDEF)-like protein